MIAGFLNSAIVRDLSRAEMVARKLPLKWWGEFEAPLVAYSRISGRVVVPQGFLTDGASVPRAVWAILPTNDPAILYPSYVHDYLYSLKGELPGKPALTRSECDAVLRELMLAVGSGRVKAALVRAALKVGGWAAWRRAK